MKTIMATCFNSVRHKLSHKIGYFDLLGFDFMVDTQLNVSQPRAMLLSLAIPLSPQVWLIEANVNPALHTNCATLHALVPPLVAETLGTWASLHYVYYIYM